MEQLHLGKRLVMHLGAKSVSFPPIIKKPHLQGEVGSHFEREKGENSILVKALLLLPSVLRVDQVNGVIFL